MSLGAPVGRRQSHLLPERRTNEQLSSSIGKLARGSASDHPSYSLPPTSTELIYDDDRPPIKQPAAKASYNSFIDTTRTNMIMVHHQSNFGQIPQKISPLIGLNLNSNSNSNDLNNNELDLIDSECRSPAGRLPFTNCTSSQGSNGSSTYLNSDPLDFNPSELNFSDVQELWYSKSAMEILIKVSFVAPVVLLGIIGNLVIIYSMYKFKPFRRRPTIIFILNMAIADLLTTLVCPTAALITDIYQFYVLGSFMCRFEGFVKITCLLVSSYSLIVLSSDWLLCVVKPCRTRMSIRQSWFVLAIIWVCSILMASPLFVWRKLRQRIWKDLVEYWCCEQLQYTKYYWLVITFFLIYLPTIFMTIVLVIILAQMDKFEAKLRREQPKATKQQVISGGRLPMSSRPSMSGTEAEESGKTATSSTGANNGCSLTIRMKYRRRIVKILFTYLLTSIVCWTPLQFTIIYRHFRSEDIIELPPWFFELAFFAQLSASLTAAMNPIIFGFLSEPFRRLVTKSLMFRLLDKMLASNSQNNQPNNHQNHNHQPQGANQKASNKHGRSVERQQRAAHLGSSKEPRNSLASQRALRLASRRAAPTANRPPASSQLNSAALHLQAAAGGKRVSFNTPTTVEGRDNPTFEPATSSKSTEQRRGQMMMMSTTSFISRQQGTAGRPISMVSMDSINIEENIEDQGTRYRSELESGNLNL